MQRDIWLIANHPAVVRYWRNVKKLARSQLKYASTVEGHRRCAGQHQANMFNITPGCANAWSDVLAPLPTWLVCGATNGHTADMYKLKATFLQNANFVRRFEPLEDHRYLPATHSCINAW